MNKNTKIWINYGFGAIVSAVLLGSIWLQLSRQLQHTDIAVLSSSWDSNYLLLAIMLMPLNLFVEASKWMLLTNKAQDTSFTAAFKSVLGGIAFSIITPNRIGEYPGRIIYLKRRNTIRLISVSLLGVFSQYITLFIFGLAGLFYYQLLFPSFWVRMVFCIAAGVLVFLLLLFFFFEKWSGYIARWRWFRKFNTYGYLMQRFSAREQMKVLGFSMLRFMVYTAQYLVLLHWMGISVSLWQGLFAAFLFFWSIAVIPSIALAELGVRGKLSLFLFQHITTNTVGVLSATIGLWFINLMIPAIAGSFLLLKMRLFKIKTEL